MEVRLVKQPFNAGIVIADAGNIGSASDKDAIAIASDGVVTMNQIPVLSAGLNVSGGTIAGTIATATQNSITTATGLTTVGAGGNCFSYCWYSLFTLLTHLQYTLLMFLEQTILHQATLLMVIKRWTLSRLAITILLWVFDAMGANTTGAANVSVGKDALKANTTASYNIAAGFEAMTANTTGTRNLAIGKICIYCF